MAAPIFTSQPIATDISSTGFTASATVTAAAALGDGFVFTLQTTGPTETFTLGVHTGTYLCNVEWGDGQNDDYDVSSPGTLTHQYATADTYQVKITGTSFGGINLGTTGDLNKVISIDQMGDCGMVSLATGFTGSTSLVSVSSGPAPSMTGLTSMANCFDACVNLAGTADLSNLDLSQCTTLARCFWGCSSLEWVDIGGTNMTGVTSVVSLFQNCTSMQGVLNTTVDQFASLTTANHSHRNMPAFQQALDYMRFSSGMVSNSNLCGVSTALLPEHYDATMAHWRAGASFPSGWTLDMGNSTYSAAGAVDKQWLFDTYSLTLVDGGEAP